MSEMMWGGRFQKAEEKSALDFNASVSYDCRMYKEDIAGSLAHASMLADRGIISKEDLEKITGGLLKIKKEKKIKVTIEDFGVGISEKALPHIFERFYREDEARNREIKSYGLGLSIVKEIVALLNIDIQVESQLGKGTKITLQL